MPGGTAKESRLEQLRPKQVRTDGATQSRIDMDEDLIAQLAKKFLKQKSAGYDPHLDPPIPDPVLFWDGRHYWPGDGHHRIDAMLQAKIQWHSFRVYDGTERDAFLFAAGCNSRHGSRRRPEDVRYCIRRMLQDSEWKDWPNNEIARRCKCDPHTVADEKRRLWEETHPHYERAHSEKGSKKTKFRTKHGTTSTMDTSKIGKNKTAYRVRPVYEKDRPHLREKAEKLLQRSPMRVARQALTAGWSWDETVAALRKAWDSIPVEE
jgi:hypothetical protein